MPRPPGAIAAALLICKKDLVVERRTGEIVTSAGIFAVMTGFLASLAFYVKASAESPLMNASLATGAIWITLFFAALLSFGRVWQRERDESALIGLLVSPIPRASIFLGKSLAAFVMILLVEIPLVLLCALVFDVTLTKQPLALLVFLVAGTLAVTLLGTLFGAMTVRTRARDLVLAIVLLPLLSPVLVCGIVGTRMVLQDLPFGGDGGSSEFLVLLGLFDFVALAGGIGLFGALVDD